MIFGHLFFKDPITIHEQIYGTLNLSMYRSYPQSYFSVTFFLKSYHIKSIVPSATKYFGFFPEKKSIFIINIPHLFWFEKLFFL